MIRLIDFQLRLQNPVTGAILYPPVRTFSTVDSLPFDNAPSASIEVLSSSTLSDLRTVSLVEYDDIVRLRGAIRYHPDDTPVFVDLFEGRVQNMGKNTGSGNTVNLDCVGHISEAFKNLQKYTYDWYGTDIKTILSYVANQGHKLGRIEYDPAYITSSGPYDYNIEEYQVMLSDILQDLEKLASYGYFFSTKQIYDKWGTLLNCYLSWEPLATTPTTIYKINEGSNRLISADVTVIGEDVVTYRYVRGGTNEYNEQYKGEATDALAIAKYGPKESIDSYTWIKSDYTCGEIARGQLQASKEPAISIQVVLEGTLDAKKGQLVSVDLQSLDIKGVSVNGNYPVLKVQQALTDSGEFTTTLDLNHITPDENLYRFGVTKQVQNCAKNQRKSQAAPIAHD
jgi:hypothetical protein